MDEKIGGKKYANENKAMRMWKNNKQK